MKKILFAIGALALGLTAAAPAHADFAIVKFNSGYCRIFHVSPHYSADRHHGCKALSKSLILR